MEDKIVFNMNKPFSIFDFDDVGGGVFVVGVRFLNFGDIYFKVFSEGNVITNIQQAGNILKKADNISYFLDVRVLEVIKQKIKEYQNESKSN